MVATFLASSSLTLLHLDGWLLCWALWLPPWRAVFAVNAAKPNLTPRRWSRSPSCQITSMKLGCNPAEDFVKEMQLTTTVNTAQNKDAFMLEGHEFPKMTLLCHVQIRN